MKCCVSHYPTIYLQIVSSNLCYFQNRGMAAHAESAGSQLRFLNASYQNSHVDTRTYAINVTAFSSFDCSIAAGQKIWVYNWIRRDVDRDMRVSRHWYKISKNKCFLVFCFSVSILHWKELRNKHTYVVTQNISSCGHIRNQVNLKRTTEQSMDPLTSMSEITRSLPQA